MMLSEDNLKTLMRGYLSIFLERVFRQLDPGAQYIPNWHIDLIAYKLELVLSGRIKRLIINVPPRSMKSMLVSVALVAWALGHDPRKRFICASYGQDLADKLAQDFRAVVQSQWYRDLFPTRLKGSRPAIADLMTQEEGGRFSTSVGGVMTGRGADIMIFDDVMKPEEALSDLRRKSVNEWVGHTALSRLNDKREGAVIVVMQRLHEDDLAGYLMAQGGWEVLSLPAIAEEAEVFEYETLYGSQRHTREPGDVLHPEREPIGTLQAIKTQIGEYNFAGQYQQRPAPLGGAMVRNDWLRYYDENDLPAHFDMVLQSWDTANKESELSDFSVCTTWGITEGRLYLIDVLREKMEYPRLKQAVLRQLQRFEPNKVLIEDQASGTQLIQELRAQGQHKIIGIKIHGSKIMRLNAQTSVFEAGQVWLPTQAPWLDAYRHELLTFPGSKHDDQVDSTTNALQYLAMHGIEPGLLTYMREEAMRHGWRPRQ